MLFDPSSDDRAVDAGPGTTWQPSGAAVAGHRSSAGVLTLPDVGRDVPPVATIRLRPDSDVDGLVLDQFRHAPLRASDVVAPTSSADAFQQAFFAWFRRQLPQPLRFISIGVVLCDTNAVHDEIKNRWDKDDFKPTSALHLGVILANDLVHEMGALAQPLRHAHPLLLHTLFSVVDQVSFRTVPIRTPGWILSEKACRDWEGEEGATDDEAREWLEQAYGDKEVAALHLPSVIRPLVCPDEIRCPPKVAGRRSRKPDLSLRELRELASTSSGMVSAVCREIVALRLLLGAAGKRELLNDGYYAGAIYSGCAFVLEANETITEFLDDHMNMEYQAGEANELERFITFSSTKKGIREQYAQWSLAFQMLRRLDRLLALVVSP
jgi:PRTRC genetic system protein F